MSNNIPKYKLTWVTEDEPDEEWLWGEQHIHEAFFNNKTELFQRIEQAKTEQGYDFDVYIWDWNQYVLTNIPVK